MNPAGTRLAAAAVVAAAGALAGVVAACGLPRAGLGAAVDAAAGGGDDSSASADGESTGNDAGSPACTGVDAACLGPLPSGWQPIALGDGGCLPGFSTANLVTNARIEDGGCACGACQAIGTFECEASVPVSGGDNNCGDPPFVTATPGACTQGQAQHVDAHPPLASGNVACFAANDAGSGVTVDPFTMCVPDCTTDYCSATTSRCVVADDVIPCPSGFNLLARAGTGADPGCAPCACEAGAPGPCAGSITIFGDTACSPDASFATYTVGTCNEYSTDYQSLLVALVPPAPTCFPAAGGAEPGDASLVQVRTICCQ